MLSSTRPVSLGYLPDHMASQAARSRRFGEVAAVLQPAQLLVERIPEEMHITALIGRLRQNLTQRRSEAGMIVGDDKFAAA